MVLHKFASPRWYVHQPHWNYLGAYWKAEAQPPPLFCILNKICMFFICTIGWEKQCFAKLSPDPTLLSFWLMMCLSILLYNHNFDHNFCIVPRLPKPHKTLKQILCAFCTRTPMSILLLPTYQSSFFFCNFTAILPFSSWWGLLSNAWAEMCVLSFKIIRSASWIEHTMFPLSYILDVKLWRS